MEEKRRLGKQRAAESRARRRSYTEFNTADVAVEVEATPVGSMEVEEIEETEENYFHGAPPDAMFSENELVILEDTRVGEPSKVFWEILAVVKSRRYVNSQWLYVQKCRVQNLLR